MIYSVQHVRSPGRRAPTASRAAPGVPFGPAEHVDPAGGDDRRAAVTPAGRVLVAWSDPAHGARVHVSEAAPTGPLAATGELGADVTAKRSPWRPTTPGRAVVAWPQRASTAPAFREQAIAAMRPRTEPPSARRSPWAGRGGGRPGAGAARAERRGSRGVDGAALRRSGAAPRGVAGHAPALAAILARPTREREDACSRP